MALRIALVVGAVAALAQPLVEDFAAKSVAGRQPATLVAMEALFETQGGGPLLVGGIPDVDARSVSTAIERPHLLRFLAHGDLDAEVIGLAPIPRDAWPPVVIVHTAFPVMVGADAVTPRPGCWC